MLNVTEDAAGQSDLFKQFEGGVKLGIGSFNLVGLQRGFVFFPPPEVPDGRSFTAEVHSLQS